MSRFNHLVSHSLIKKGKDKDSTVYLKVHMAPQQIVSAGEYQFQTWFCFREIFALLGKSGEARRWLSLDNKSRMKVAVERRLRFDVDLADHIKRKNHVLLINHIQYILFVLSDRTTTIYKARCHFNALREYEPLLVVGVVATETHRQYKMH